MCGIMASIGKSSIKKVYDGLIRLEYRGYDSCGIACKVGNEIKCSRVTGYISNLSSTDIMREKSSTIAIGHTRWATHGGVTIANSHPHKSSDGNFVVVHNGIVENFTQLKNGVLKDVEFKSDTDTEVVPQLVEFFYKQCGDVWESFQKTIQLIEGSYAIVMIDSYDDKLYFARKSSPMIIGKSKEGYAISSDINGLCGCDHILYVEDNCVGNIDNNVDVIDKNNRTIVLNWIENKSNYNKNDLSSHTHYMHKEIFEIPNSLMSSFDKIRRTKFYIPKNIEHVLLVGCGTSYHSSLLGKKYIEEVAKIPCECVLASEFIYNNYLVQPNTLAIFISQSGETADTLTALRRAKELGLYTLSITNVESSTITSLSHDVLYLNVGAEICVASTKAYTSQVFLLLILSNILLNNIYGNYTSCDDVVGFVDICDGDSDGLVCVDWDSTINYLNISKGDFDVLFNLDVSYLEEEVAKILDQVSACRELHLIGKDYDFITALEGALKIKEVSYIFTDAYACGELKHGTLSLIENGSVVLSILTQEGVLFDKSKNAIHEISARGGHCIVFSQLEKSLFEDCKGCISLPFLHKYFMPIVSIVAIDLLAYKLSVARGINPDKPRNLAKSVTVE